MTEEDIYPRLTTLFEDIFMRDNITIGPETTARDVPEWDSHKQIELILAVEEHFNVRFNTREIDGLKRVGDLVELIKTKS